MSKECDCKCYDCRIEFSIKFKKSVPPWSLTCPVCSGRIIDVKWKE